MDFIEGSFILKPVPTLPTLTVDGLTPTVGFSDQLPAPPPPAPREPTEEEIDQQIAALPAPLIPIPSLEEMRAKFEELDTKTLILGMAGLLTAVLFFKK